MSWRLELQHQVKQLLQEASFQRAANDVDQAVQTYQRAAALLEDLGDLDLAIEVYEKLLPCTSGELRAGIVAYIGRIKERGVLCNWDGRERLRGPLVANKRNGGHPPESPGVGALT